MAIKVRRVNFYPDEFLAGVSMLTAEEIGVYWIICTLIMSQGGEINNDKKWIGRQCNIQGAKAQRIIEKLKSLEKIAINDGKISQKRAENEIKIALNRIEKATKNGQKGGRKSREIKELNEAPGFRFIEANHQPVTINHQPVTSSLIKSDDFIKQKKSVNFDDTREEHGEENI